METGKRPQTIEQRQKQVISRLTNENRNLRERVTILEQDNQRLKQELEKAFLLIEELRRMIFGKGKKKDRNNNHDDNDLTGNSQGKRSDRNNSSYRRPVPSEEEITTEEHHDSETCPYCQNKLSQLKKLVFFTEDVLPLEQWFKVLKQITRKWITTGYCSHCQKRVSSIEIPKQKVSLGENIRQLIVFQATIEQLSYSQIINFAEGMLRFKLSKGEIVNILENQAFKLNPAYLTIQENIRSAEAINMDETGWPTLQGNQGNFAWVAANVKNEEVIYSLGQSRGKGNVNKLLGKNYLGIGVTDDYGAYKNIFPLGNHALCWAHPYRKIRDLKNSETLKEELKIHCQQVFKDFSVIYQKVREVNLLPFNKKEREKEVENLSKLFDNFIRPHPNDPQKLKQIKIRLAEQKDCYFVCLLKPNIPPDNNKAERALRHLVIKRRKSFGSKTQKGADMLSIIYSVVMSLWRKSKQNFFSSYNQALNLVGGTQ